MEDCPFYIECDLKLSGYETYVLKERKFTWGEIIGRGGKKFGGKIVGHFLSRLNRNEIIFKKN